MLNHPTIIQNWMEEVKQKLITIFALFSTSPTYGRVNWTDFLCTPVFFNYPKDNSPKKKFQNREKYFSETFLHNFHLLYQETTKYRWTTRCEYLLLCYKLWFMFYLTSCLSNPIKYFSYFVFIFWKKYENFITNSQRLDKNVSANIIY